MGILGELKRAAKLTLDARLTSGKGRKRVAEGGGGSREVFRDNYPTDVGGYLSTDDEQEKADTSGKGAKKLRLEDFRDLTSRQELRERRSKGTKKSSHDRSVIAAGRSAEAERTLFVGNVPVGCKKADLVHLFKPYGSIESLRFRSIVPASDKISKGVAFQRGIHGSQAQSINAYIVFRDVASATAAAELNGSLLRDRHLRVNMAADAHKPGSKKLDSTLFVGNLPFDCDEEEVWKYFGDYGGISNVRLIRDPVSGKCKGFGYVSFVSQDGYQIALETKRHLFVNRELRVSCCVRKPKVKLTNVKGGNTSKASGRRFNNGKKVSSTGQNSKVTSSSAKDFSNSKSSSKKVSDSKTGKFIGKSHSNDQKFKNSNKIVRTSSDNRTSNNSSRTLKDSRYEQKKKHFTNKRKEEQNHKELFKKKQHNTNKPYKKNNAKAKSNFKNHKHTIKA